MKNNIIAGDYVICISDNFPIQNPNGNEVSHTFPAVGDIEIVDEVLGNYLRFDKHDSYLEGKHVTCNWFFYNRFKKLDGDQIIAFENNKGFTSGAKVVELITNPNHE